LYKFTWNSVFDDETGGVVVETGTNGGGMIEGKEVIVIWFCC
jgi:hypothetical protein